MKRTIISLIIAIAIIIVGGVFELNNITCGYCELSEKLSKLLISAENETITDTEFCEVFIFWTKLREESEVWLNHNDINEINMRMAECESYIKKEDYEQARMQINVMLFFADYIPRSLRPTLQNIF